jgi:hypothetical protein
MAENYGGRSTADHAGFAFAAGVIRHIIFA